MGCHTEEVPISRSIGLRSGGVGEEGGIDGTEARGRKGVEEEEGGVAVGDKGGGRGEDGVTSEGVCGIETGLEGETGVGVRGGGRFDGGLKETGGADLEVGGSGGGRDGGVAGGRGGREGSWEEDFTAGGGGLGRNGRVGGWDMEEEEEGWGGGEMGEDGGREAGGGVTRVSRDPVRGLVWPVSWETTLTSIISPQIEYWTALCHSQCLAAPSKTPPLL